MGAAESAIEFETNFAPVEGWPGYLVGNDGHVYSIKPHRGSTWRRLAEGRDRDGYPTVQLTHRGVSKTLKTHRIVCAAFHGKGGLGLEVRHLNGSRADNRSENLAWGTAKENAADRDAHGRTARGERNLGGGKLTQRQAAEIKRRALSGGNQSSLAREFGVSVGMVNHIKAGRKWRHA